MMNDMVSLINSADFDIPNLTWRCLTKYTDRGFDYVLSCSTWMENHRCGLDASCAETLRHVDDHGCMRLPFTTDKVGAEADVIDPGLAWMLASRCRCQNTEDFLPSNGTVLTSNGCILSESSCVYMSGDD